MLHQGLCLLLLGVVACYSLPTEHLRAQRQLFSPEFPFVPAVAGPQRFAVPPAPFQEPYYYPAVAGAYNVPQVKYGFPQIQYGVLPAAPAAAAPSGIRYAPALVATNGQQQVIFTPPGPNSLLPSSVVVYRPSTKEEGGASEEGYIQSFLNFVNHYVWPQPAPAEEGTSGAESPAESEKPEKVQAANTAEKEDKKGEKQNEKKEDAVVVEKATPQRYVVLSEPQFFGRYGGIPQTIRQPQVLPAVNKGAVSSYLLFRNFGGAPGEGQREDYAQGPVEGEFDASQNTPGRAALSYQKLLAQANQREDDSGVVVEAASKDAKEPQQTADNSTVDSESEKVDADEETGKRRQQN
uniref:DUF4794 domain-containing protein n=1 Tax=Clastoptera arizonana TaxID=38151 RepID=A0A1B6EGF5_9HEMI